MLYGYFFFTPTDRSFISKGYVIRKTSLFDNEGAVNPSELVNALKDYALKYKDMYGEPQNFFFGETNKKNIIGRFLFSSVSRDGRKFWAQRETSEEVAKRGLSFSIASLDVGDKH